MKYSVSDGTYRIEESLIFFRQKCNVFELLSR